MKTAEDFKRAIGPADPEFEAALRRALRGLENGKKRPGRKRGALAAVLFFVLLTTGTAYAAGNGLRLGDLFNIWKNPPSSAEKSGTQFAVAGNTEAACASYRVREAFCDGRKIYVVIEVKPRDENALAVSERHFHVFRNHFDGTYEPEDFLAFPTDHFSLWWLDIDGKGSQTVEEYLAETGKYLIPCNLSLFIVDEQGNLGYPDRTYGEGWRTSNRTLEDGTMLYMETIPWKTEEPEIRLAIFGELNKRVEQYTILPEEENRMQLTIPVQRLTVTAARGEGPVSFARNGMRASDITAQLTDFGLEIQIHWSWDQESSETVYREAWAMGVLSPVSVGDERKTTGPFGLSGENWQDLLAYFSEVTEMPETLTLFYAGETREVRLIPAEPEPAPENAKMNWFALPVTYAARQEVPVSFVRNGMRVNAVTAEQRIDGFLKITVFWDWDDSEQKYIRLNPASMGVRLPGADVGREQTLRYGQAEESHYEMEYVFMMPDKMPESVYIRYGDEEAEVRLYPLPSDF